MVSRTILSEFSSALPCDLLPLLLTLPSEGTRASLARLLLLHRMKAAIPKRRTAKTTPSVIPMLSPSVDVPEEAENDEDCEEAEDDEDCEEAEDDDDCEEAEVCDEVTVVVCDVATAVESCWLV